MTNAATALFREGTLSVGVALPVRSGSGPEIDMMQQVEVAAAAEALGFAAIWVRDVPLNGPWYPENFGHTDPVVMLGAIAARTSRVVIGTAAIVLPLRHPLHIAKSAISLERLSGGRFILGLGSGDRPEEFAAFGEAKDGHKELYRDHWSRVAAALERPPRILTLSSQQETAFELRPMAKNSIPMLAVGSGGQSLEWIARNSIGWATYHRTRAVQRDRHALWRRAVDKTAAGVFRSFSVAVRIELAEDPAAAAEDIDLGYRAGGRALRTIVGEMREDGIHHLILNIMPTGRPAKDMLAEIAHAIF